MAWLVIVGCAGLVARPGTRSDPARPLKVLSRGTAAA